jgi:outer membrane receptor protein involved in Fe transport
MSRKVGGILVAAAAAFVFASWVMAQVSSGSISGTVRDEKGAPLQGAQVTVTSARLQGPRTMATDSDGGFLIPYLPPAGDYRVSVEAAGHSRVVQSQIAVALGTTTVLQMALAGAGQEIQCIASPPALDLKTTRLGTNFGQEELEGLPIGRKFQESFYLAPNVVDSGSPFGPGVSGSTVAESVYTINGLNITDPVGGLLYTNFNYNFVGEIAVNTGGLNAEYGASTGGLFTVLTKSGSNEFHGELFGYYTSESWAANPDPTLYSSPKPQPFHNYDYGFDLGGPIVKDRLWFFAGYNPTYTTRTHDGTSYVVNTLSGAGAAIPYRYDDVSRSWLGLAKLNWRVNDEHNLELTLLTNPTHEWLSEGLGNLLGANPTVPAVDQRARMTRRTISGYDVGLRWYATFLPNFYMETQLAQTRSKGEIYPWEREWYAYPQVMSYDWYPALSVGSGTGILYQDARVSNQFDAKVTVLARRHEIKFGVGAQEMKWDTFNGYTGGALYDVRGNMTADPFSARPQDYAYVFRSSLQDPHTKEHGRYAAVFAQDTWSVTDTLSLSYGLRWERSELNPRDGQHASLDSWSPRLGLTWDFTGDGKSKLFAHWGQYYERVPMAATYMMDRGHERYYDVYAMGQHVSHNVFGQVPMTVPSGTKNQYNEEFLVGAEYEILPDAVLGLSCLYRRLGRVLENVGYVDPATGTFSFYLMNPGTGQWPAVMNAWGMVLPDYERFPHPIRNYSAYTLTFDKRFSDRWHINASYTLSFLRGNYEGGSGGYSVDILGPNISSAYDFPQHILIQNRYGWLPQDVRHNLKVQGSYRFDWGLVVGAALWWHSGRPLSKAMNYPLSGPGYGTIFVAPRGGDRLPSHWQVDLHAEYRIPVWKTQLALFADLFNATNRQAATDAYPWYYQRPSTLEDVYTGNLSRDPNWGKPTALQAPRFLRLGLKWSF